MSEVGICFVGLAVHGSLDLHSNMHSDEGPRNEGMSEPHDHSREVSGGEAAAVH